ncbi:permease [Halegenticoccus soli]|uniref:permease n=1 Tax=Halegenticoccus soli TaxID=1985678 RepID=UPI000C6D7CD9|nr:permease [Halegenticoccus soli]
MSVTQSLVEAATFVGEMTWKTWWALVLGFTVAGAVQAFVSRDEMVDVLGGGGLREIGLGSFFGFLSSSCSFGAVATTKSLYEKGASPVASLAAFQFASTNLVIEIGLVMWILLGWQFVAADFFGGVVLILLLAAIFTYAVPDSWFERAREHVRDLGGEGGHGHGDDEWARESDWTDKLATVRGWKRTFRNAIDEWSMLWTDIAAGFVVAGLIKAFVPRSFWTRLFTLAPEGTAAWVFLGCVIGVAVGVLTFICSVANVPFALVLWQNGIPFGGVMSFIFADLIVPHIDNMYRKFYGPRLAAALFASIFAAAALSGVVVHYAWAGLGLIPQQGHVGGTAPSGYTTVLNVVFTVVFLAQVYVAFFESGGEREETAAAD